MKQTEIGLIPEDWEVKTVGDVFTLSQGLQIAKNLRSSVQTEGSVPLLKITELPFGKFAEFVNSIQPQHLASRDDIIYTRTGQVGLVYTNFKGCVHNNCFKIHYDPNKFDKMFVFYFLKQKRVYDYANSVAGGSVQKDLSHPAFKSCIIAFPLLSEQKMIGKVLKDIDSKIELNQEMNKNLEAIGQAIFKRWFVDFEFPNEEGKPYKSSGGQMVHSEGLEKDIPKGWTVGKLGAFIDLDKGLSYKGAFLSDHGLPMINLGTIAPKAGFISEGIKYYTGEHKEKQLAKAGDIVIANTDITQKREVLGSPAIVPPNLGCERALFTHHIFAVRRKTSLPNLFIYYLLQLPGYRERVIGFATGTTVLALPKDAVLDFKFAVPDDQILHTFERTVDLLMAKINANTQQNKNLAQIRNMLLPKLMSGKIRVPPEKRKAS